MTAAIVHIINMVMVDEGKIGIFLEISEIFAEGGVPARTGKERFLSHELEDSYQN
jgi:hypothetical protein